LLIGKQAIHPVDWESAGEIMTEVRLSSRLLGLDVM
jgi:hypothetical protein